MPRLGSHIVPLLGDTSGTNGVVDAVRRLGLNLYVVFNAYIGRYEVWGRDVNNKPYMVMRVQNEDGSFRPLDRRVVETLWRHRDIDKVIRELDEHEERKEAADELDIARMAESIADDLCFMGRDVYRGFKVESR